MKEDSERERVRKKNRKKGTFLSFLAFVFLGVVGLLVYVLWGNIEEFLEQKRGPIETVEETKDLEGIEIISEGGGEISSRTKEYIGLLSEDLLEYGYEIIRVVLPSEKMREIDIDIQGIKPYFKINMERGSGVSAEDIFRMTKYLEERGIINDVSYIDVRVEGKAFYK